MKEKSITCITCPAGCRLKVSFRSGEIVKVKGNKCKKGIDFAAVEILNPTRILTTTIAIDSKVAKRLAIRSRDPAPRDSIKEMVREAKKIKITAPVNMGDIISENLLGSGVDIIASSTVEK